MEEELAVDALAKLIRAEEFFPPHDYTRPEDAEDDFEDCAICDENAFDCRRQQAAKENDAKTLARALLDAGYAKRSDVVEECETAIESVVECCTAYVTDSVMRTLDVQYAPKRDYYEAIRNLKDKP